MKKVFVFLIVLSLLITTILAVGAWAQPVNDLADKAKLSIPDYEKMDIEFLRESRANGETVRAREFKGIDKSYIKPADGNAIAPKDVRTKEAKGIAILVDFPSNEDGTSAVPGVIYDRVPMNKFNDLLNGTEYNPYELSTFSWLSEYNGIMAPTDRTLRNYYKEVSYDQYQIQIDLVDWVTLSKPYDYYMGQDKGFYNENGEAYMGELVLEAIKLADQDIDFSQYAINGEVPNIFIIHRGTGAEYSADPNIIWSHKWSILGANYWGYNYKTGEYMTDEMLNEAYADQVVDGVIVDSYNIVPEVGQDITGFLGVVRRPSPAYPGVYSHEFGHILGLPDQYDYGYDSEGTGMFDLMASGSYGNSMYQYYNPQDPVDAATRQYRYYSGNTPVHMNAWSKFYLCFANPTEITSNTTNLTLRPVTQAPDTYKIVVPGSNGREYFLLENRQQENYDVGLSYSSGKTDLHGLAVYHIVDSMIQKKFNRPNEAQNWDLNHLGKAQQSTSQYGQSHYGMSVIQADGLFDMERYVNDGDAGDVFPGINNITSLYARGNISPNTTSVFKWDNKSTNTGINLTNIVEHEDGTITLDVFFAK